MAPEKREPEYPLASTKKRPPRPEPGPPVQRTGGTPKGKMTTAAEAQVSPTLELSTKNRKTPEGEMTAAAGARAFPEEPSKRPKRVQMPGPPRPEPGAL